jgi:hypothetical protein
MAFSCAAAVEALLMNARTLFVSAALVSASLCYSQVLISKRGYGNVNPVCYDGGSAVVINGKGVQVSLPSSPAKLIMYMPPGTNWTGYTHLQIQVQNTGTTTEPFFFGISGTTWSFTEAMLTPGKVYDAIIPLDNPDVLVTHHFAQPPASSYPQLFASNPVDKTHIDLVVVKAPDQSAGTSILVKDMHLITAPIPSTGITDLYGQQAQITWSGKIGTDADLVAAVNARNLSGTYPFTADAYGGVSGTAQGGSATGAWHTAKQNGKWYIIDPLGNRFFSAGIVNAGNGSPAIVGGNEAAFAAGALPSQTGAYAQHYSTRYGPAGLPVLTYNFYTSNVQHRVGTSWQSSITATTGIRMRTWGFNTASSGSDFGLEQASNQTPSSESVVITGGYATLFEPDGGAYTPDVYDPNWVAAARTSVANQTQRFHGNAYSMGVFVDNEPAWAKPYVYPNARYGLCQSILGAPATQPAKIALANWLNTRYSGNVATFNANWGTSLSSFDGLLTTSLTLPASISPGMTQDLQGFILAFARTYFTTIRQALTSSGYQGLYLGCRLLYFTPEVLQACKESCDVVSFNDYDILPTYNHTDVKTLDAPVMISEVGFGTADKGRTPTYPNLLSESDRAAFFTRFTTDAIGWPNLVGLHWYKWEDDVISGRFYDGNNNCQGLVSITDVPSWGLVDAATTANTNFHRRLLTP